MNKYLKKVISKVSYYDLDVKNNFRRIRKTKNLLSPGPISINYETLDLEIKSFDDYLVPIRAFKPKVLTGAEKVIIYFHGGGWVIGNIDNYSRICMNLSKNTNTVVLSVDYRLAPEYKFPIGLQDCYYAVKSICENAEKFGFKRDDVVLMGDSAGGNLAAALSLMLRDKNEYIPQKQILVYPSTYNDHSANSPFKSVRDFGTDYILTAKRICDYMELYASSKEDFDNPYFAPLISENLYNQPDTLVLTAWYDPLRDEGEAYAQKLWKFGNKVTCKRVFDTIHGFLGLPAASRQMNRTYHYINQFLS